MFRVENWVWFGEHWVWFGQLGGGWKLRWSERDGGQTFNFEGTVLIF
jgi:hypothetical protein